MTPTTFWNTVEINRNHYGNGYVYMRKKFDRKKFGGEIKIVDLWVMQSNCVQIVVDDAGIFAGVGRLWYVYTDPTSGRQYVFSTDEVMHFKTSFSFDGITGLPVQQILRDTVAGASESQAFIGSLTDDIPEGALQTNPDGSVNTYDADGNKTGTVDAETLKEMTTVNDDVSKLATGDNEQGTPQENAEDDENASNEDKATNPPTEQENGENGANTEPDKATEEQQEDKVIIPQGKMRVTVICDGSLNIRRSAAWGNDNICGRAIRGQSYYVKEIHVVDGKKMVRTIGDLYLSGESEHVQFEQL